MNVLCLVVLIHLLFAKAQDSCQPCANGEDATSDFNEDCRELIETTLSLAKGTDECLSSQLENFQRSCCKTAPRGLCTLCPDGSSFDAGKGIPNFDPQGEDFTCADFNADETALDFIFQAGICEDTLLQRSAAWCDCPGVTRECALCTDGRPVPNRERIEYVYYGWNCAAFDCVSSYFSTSECGGLINEIFEFDAAAFCGCPGSPVPEVCELCPDGEELINPDLKLEDGYTCQQLALSTSFIPEATPCIRFLTNYRSKDYISLCCGKANGSAANNSLSKLFALQLLLGLSAMVIGM
jgi:hypothetical protein